MREGRFTVLAIDVQRGVDAAWDHVATFVPKLFAFLAIVIVGYVIAKALRRLVDTVLERIGFDGWVDRGMFGRGLDRAGVDASDVLAIIVFWAAFLLSLQLAFGIFGQNPISDVLERLIAYLPNVFVAVVILVIAAVLASVVIDVLGAVLSSAPAGRWIARIAGLTILTVGVFAALDQLEIAPVVVTVLYDAVLTVIVGVGIVAIGIGGMRTMRGYWERASSSIDASARDVKRLAEARAKESEAKAEADKAKEAAASAERLEVEEDSIAISIDSDPEWKPPRARGYELGSPSK